MTPTLRSLSPTRAVRPVAAALLVLLLTGCGAITLKTQPSLSTRNLPAANPPPASVASAGKARTAPGTEAGPEEGLRLARLLRDQGRLEGAMGVYAQLDQRGALQPLELLEYASVAALRQTPQESLALYGRARRALGNDLARLQPAALATLHNGLGRARMALNQTDAALADFDATLRAEPNDTVALNAKGVLLDARGDHAEARPLFARASELDPADYRALNNLALSYLSAGEPQQAIRLLLQTDAPQWPALKLNLALAYALDGQDLQARQTLEGFMPARLATQALQDFEQRRQRIRQGTPVAGELMAASRQLLELRNARDHE